MTKVTVRVVGDSITKNGRAISFLILDTDNEVTNDYLDLPININKTYALNTSLQEIRKDMKASVKTHIKNIEKRITTLVGKELEFNV